MREIKDIASVLRDSMASLKQQAQAAKDAFNKEVEAGKANIAKVHSMTKELKAANQEVEQMLGQSGSNFPPDAEASPPDVNGVVKNG